MSLDWCPGIREACEHWPDAPMLQQTFEELQRALADDNDACIDSAKAIVEVVCRLILDELDNPSAPARPAEALPDFGVWMASAVRVLKIGDDPRDRSFQKLVSQHHKLTSALGALRNDAGSASHGRQAFLDRLSAHHRRAAVLAADAIVTFLHGAYLDAEIDWSRTREPYDRFQEVHDRIDANVSLSATVDDDGLLAVEVLLPSGDTLPMRVEASRLLYQLDRAAYREAVRATRGLTSTTDDAALEAGGR
jgi:hypothetical protein